MKMIYVKETIEDLKERFPTEDLARRCSNVTLLPLETYNIRPAYRWADALVSEASSTIVEFTILDKPIIVCDQLHHLLRSGRYLQRRMDTELLNLLDFAHHAPTADQASYAMEHPGELSDRRKTGHDLLVGPYDGQTSQRIVDILEKAVA